MKLSDAQKLLDTQKMMFRINGREEMAVAIEIVLQALEETKKQKDQLMELYHQRVQEIIDLKQDMEDIDLTVPYMQGREDEKAIWRNKIKEEMEKVDEEAFGKPYDVDTANGYHSQAMGMWCAYNKLLKGE